MSPKRHQRGSGASEHEAAPTVPAFSAVHGDSIVGLRLDVSIEREAGVSVVRSLQLESDVVRIGSHPSSEVVLSDPRVSRFHCRIERVKGSWHVVDSDSLNGTHIAGIRVWDAALPIPECHLELGDSRVRILQVEQGSVVPLLPHARFGALHGRSSAMRRLFAVIERIAQSDANVLIEGETGTGKDLVATEIAERGGRADKPFVIIDCGAIAPTLVESTLFGHARGAFTGADRDRAGAFEAATGGTVFLDEIGEMPLEMQPKLLRVLESREVCRIGETKKRTVNVRVLAATNRRLEIEVNHGRFREDLFFRLSVVTVRIPPLRERLEDLELLVSAMLESFGAKNSRGLFTNEALAHMAQYNWPGNVRELRNAVERAVVMKSVDVPFIPQDGDAAEPIRDPSRVAAQVDLDVPLKIAKEQLIAEFEKKYVAALLEWAGGNVARAARRAGMDRINMHRVIQKHGLRASRSIKA